MQIVSKDFDTPCKLSSGDNLLGMSNSLELWRQFSWNVLVFGDNLRGMSKFIL